MPLSIVTPTLKCFVTGNIELSPTGPSSLKVRVHATRVSDIMLQTREIKCTSTLWLSFQFVDVKIMTV